MAANAWRMRAWIWWALLNLVAAAVGIALGLLAPLMAAVKPGRVDVFCTIAYGVPDVTGSTDWDGDAYFVDDRWAAYDQQHLHGSDIYYVPVAEVEARFPQVVDSLERAANSAGDRRVVHGFRAWQADEGQSHTCQSLLAQIKLVDSNQRDPQTASFNRELEAQFWQRWRAADDYWMNIAGEWLYLTGVTVFALWPGLWQKSIYRWAVHLAFVPLLIILPAWLGYATYTFTSRGPSGGVFYPWLIVWIRGFGLNELDVWVLTHLPPVLAPLSQGIGAPVALTGRGMPGPTTALVMGLFLAGTALAIARIVRVVREQRDSVQRHMNLPT